MYFKYVLNRILRLYRQISASSKNQTWETIYPVSLLLLLLKTPLEAPFCNPSVYDGPKKTDLLLQFHNSCCLPLTLPFWLPACFIYQTWLKYIFWLFRSIKSFFKVRKFAHSDVIKRICLRLYGSSKGGVMKYLKEVYSRESNYTELHWKSFISKCFLKNRISF